jgi:hypothetical protein
LIVPRRAGLKRVKKPILTAETAETAWFDRLTMNAHPELSTDACSAVKRFSPDSDGLLYVVLRSRRTIERAR